MRDKDEGRIKLILKILKKEERLIKNDLIERLESKGKLSRQTAINAIDMAVKLEQIIREEDVRGKLPIVWLSIPPEFRKADHQYIKAVERIIELYNENFSAFRDRYESLSIDNREEGVELFQYFFRGIVVIVELMMESFKETKRWTEFMDYLKSQQEEFKKLASTETEEDIDRIASYILREHFFDVSETLEDIQYYLMEINRKDPLPEKDSSH